MRALLILLLLPFGVAGAEESNYLCDAKEQLIFGCDVGKKIVSVCASADAGPNSGYVQYRYGTREKIELAYPQIPEPAAGRFKFSHTAYSGGGASRLRFENGGYEYILFDSMVRTNFEPGEPNYPEFDAGLVVRRNGKTLQTLGCAEAESIRAPAYEWFDREPFEDDLP